MKSNLATRLFRRRDQLPNRLNNPGDIFVVFPHALLQFFKFLRQLTIGLKGFMQLYESTHDGDVYFDRAFALQDTGKHGHTLLSKSVRAGPQAAPTWYSKLEFQVSTFLGSKLKHEIGWEALAIALNRFIEITGYDSVKPGQIYVEQDLFAAQN